MLKNTGKKLFPIQSTKFSSRRRCFPDVKIGTQNIYVKKDLHTNTVCVYKTHFSCWSLSLWLKINASLWAHLDHLFQAIFVHKIQIKK